MEYLFSRKHVQVSAIINILSYQGGGGNDINQKKMMRAMVCSGGFKLS